MVEVTASTPAVRLGSELLLKLCEAPDPGAVRADVGLDVGGRLADGGQVDAEQLRAGRARGQAGLPAWPVVHLDLMTEELLDAELAEPPFPEIVGVSEAAKLLGVTKQRLLQLTERTDFPAPMVRLAAGPVWLAASVRAFDRHWTRKPGRPAKVEANQPSNSDRVVRNARGGSISNKSAVKRNSQRD